MAAVVVAWLVFSVFKKVLGLALVAILALGVWILWSSPETLNSLMKMLP